MEDRTLVAIRRAMIELDVPSSIVTGLVTIRSSRLLSLGAPCVASSLAARRTMFAAWLRIEAGRRTVMRLIFIMSHTLSPGHSRMFIRQVVS